ncbi:hypothetical protein AMJ50_02885 [Parcubacteria bacterium DG_74_3]|nr:MAG: hypothetical protein AMJ50_02885 [Parcubacteria bacterium DG_74_3]
MKRETLLAMLVVGGIILGQGILAQGVKIGISPTTFELTSNPGDLIINQLKVYNASEDSSIGIIIEIEDIAPRGEIGHVVVEPAETETYSLARWVKVEPKEFTLEPKSQQFVTFTISVPENAEPGGHYGTILATTRFITGPEMTGTTIAQRIGALVLLSVSGEVNEELVVKDFSAPDYSEYGPISFLIRFENKGTIHVKPRGFVTITDWLGNKVADVEFPQRNVLPNAVRKIEVSWDKKWLWAGKYTATLNGSYGMANTPFSTAVITFWAFPWKAGLVIWAFVVLLILSRKRWIAAFKILLKGEKAMK